MTELERPRDPAMDAFVADVILGVDRELDSDMPAPDLMAVLDLAQRLDPQSVPDGWIREAAGLTPVIHLREGRKLRQLQDDAGMDEIVSDVRAAMDHTIGVELARRVGEDRPTTGVPADSLTPARTSSRRGWVLGLAAAALLMVGGASLLTARLAQRQEDARPLAAASEHPSTAPKGELETRDAGLETATRPLPESLEEHEDHEEDPLDPANEEPNEAPDEDDGVTPRASTARTHAPTKTRTQRLTELDAEAHAAWKAGDLALARTKFETIVQIGGRHRLADLAYGDLFTLARAGGHDRLEARLWKAYLGRFPRGRFSDDARAGLCRQASTSEQVRCWERYLRDMPKGSYRAQAEQALARSSQEK
jgi:hypothetical protein